MAVIAAMAMLQPVDARPRALTAAEWRTDLAELDAAIRDTHPRPFLRVSEADYTAAVAALDSDIPGLADKAIVVRLAAIVALLDDGHTRLTLPRQHPGLGLEFGHTRTAQPTETALHFSQLPVAFAHFEDGLFVVGAATEHRDLIGRRLVSIGARSAEQALDAIRSIAAADNVRAERSMGVDLLSLPDALAALGIAAHADWIDAVLSDSVGVTSSHRFKPLPLGDI